MKRVSVVLFVAFFCFILWVIFMANTGAKSIFFSLVASIPYGDKLGHFMLFGLLSASANFACKLNYLKFGKIRLYYGALLVFTFAALEELSQGLVASRTMDASDLFFDGLGIVTFSAFCYAYQVNMEKKEAHNDKA